MLVKKLDLLKKTRLVLVVAVLVGAILSYQFFFPRNTFDSGKAYASSGPLIDEEALQGVNRVVFQENYGPAALEVLGITMNELAPLIKKFLNDTFLPKNKTIKIVHSNEIIGEVKKTTRDLFVEVSLSARQEKGAPNKAASLQIQISVDGKIISTPLIAYPFIVPADKAQFEKMLYKGMGYLTSYLPGTLACVNDGTQCTGYDVEPFGETP